MSEEYSTIGDHIRVPETAEETIIMEVLQLPNV